MLGHIDDLFVRSFGQLATHHPIFDRLVTQLLAAPSVKILPIFAVLVYVWFESGADIQKQKCCIEAICASFISLAISRIVQNLSPSRPRPLHSGNPAYVPPVGVDLNMLKDWSSFPSDHAAMVFAISTAVYIRSRFAGILCYIWSIFAVCMPRMYSGYHYFSDTLAGATLGTIIAVIISLTNIPSLIFVPIKRLEILRPGVFYAASLILVFQFATMFDDVRRSIRFLFGRS